MSISLEKKKKISHKKKGGGGVVEGREQDSATNPENRTFSLDFVIFAFFFFFFLRISRPLVETNVGH